MELLIPAGNRDCLETAVMYGADAVYLGGARFGARKYADNFNNEALLSAVEFCHLYGVRVYVTVNTVVFDRECTELFEYIDFLSHIGVDAVIVQDLGVASIVQRVAPMLPIHASTQMVIHDLPGVEAAKELGFKRIVLARELPIAEIRHIRENTDAELEVFGHGALCMSYSGQCYMSSVIGGRSGNRGCCAQPCRLNYKMGKQEKQLLSLKDLCSLAHLKDLEDAGVTSLKIEGRMKGKHYVSVVTDVYRTCLDGKTPDEDDFKRLKEAFDRDGFTDGYLTGELGQKMFSFSRPENPYGAAETPEKRRKVPIVASCRIRENEHAILTVSDGVFTISKESSVLAEHAERVALSRERVLTQLTKTGETVFSFSDIQLELDDGCALPIKELNAIRREALETLAEKRKKRIKRPFSGQTYVPPCAEQVESKKVKLFISVETKEQALAVADRSDVLFLPPDLWETRDACRAECVLAIPRFASEKRMLELCEMAKKTSAGVLVSDLGQLHFFKDLKCYGAPELNITNSEAISVYKDLGLDYCGISYEVSLRRIRDLQKFIPVFVFAYGHMPLMITRNCLVRSALHECGCPAEITDRTGATFSVVKSEGCRNEIRNGTVLFNADRLSDFWGIGISAMYLKMTTETPEECEKIVGMYCQDQVVDMPQKYTRGHLYKILE